MRKGSRAWPHSVRARVPSRAFPSIPARRNGVSKGRPAEARSVRVRRRIVTGAHGTRDSSPPEARLSGLSG